MKQTEKLDFILNELYKFRNTSGYYLIPDIAWDIADEGEDWQKRDEISRLAKRLENDGLITAIWMRDGANAKITSHGIDYCETSSYSNSSISIPAIVKDIHVYNSSNVNIVSNSQGTAIHNRITNNDKSIEIIKVMLDQIRKDDSIDSEKKDEIIELLEDITDKLENNKPAPKHFKTWLLDYGSKISSIGNFAINLGKLLFSE